MDIKRSHLQKTVLCIVDGFGYSPRADGNAVTAADMQNFNRAFAEYPSTYIKASGKEVGLDSDKDAGNSEVGHNAIGAGQTIKQGLSLLNEKYTAPANSTVISTGNTQTNSAATFNSAITTPATVTATVTASAAANDPATPPIFQTDTWRELSAAAKKQKLDIIILLSDGRVHSDIAHLFAVLKQCKAENITVRIFAIADGRDVVPRSIKNYIAQTNEFIEKIGVSAKIAAVGGRGQFFMDRYEAQTELLTKGFAVCVAGEAETGGTEQADDMYTRIDEFYAKNPTATDEQLPPFILDSDGLIKNGDAVLLLNYRGDRAIETARMFESGAYISPEQYEQIKDCYFAGALQYDAENELPKNYLCPPPNIENTLTEWLCAHGIKQYTVTETVKFGHLTYFFNGNRTDPFDKNLEDWCEIESDKLNNQYDRAPKMKAAEIADKLIFNIRHGDYLFYKCNFPNPDMVGHTGIFPAAVTACQFIDKQLGRLIEVCRTDRVNLIITADHGNAEEMTDEKGNIKTSHTNNPVPFIVCPFASARNTKLKDGNFGLTNIAATVCDLIGIPANPIFNESIIR